MNILAIIFSNEHFCQNCHIFAKIFVNVFMKIVENERFMRRKNIWYFHENKFHEFLAKFGLIFYFRDNQKTHFRFNSNLSNK
jgi:hypothetical protein